MIIDFHANYNHNSFKNSFRYLTGDENSYAVRLCRLPIQEEA